MGEADAVQELIRAAGFHETMANDLDPWVRDKFVELWRSVDAAKDGDPF